MVKFRIVEVRNLDAPVYYLAQRKIFWFWQSLFVHGPWSDYPAKYSSEREAQAAIDRYKLGWHRKVVKEMT